MALNLLCLAFLDVSKFRGSELLGLGFLGFLGSGFLDVSGFRISDFRAFGLVGCVMGLGRGMLKSNEIYFRWTGYTFSMSLLGTGLAARSPRS